MELTGDDWRNDMRKYFVSVESLTGKALKSIKRDRLRNDLPFDDSFKEYFLQKTNVR